MSLYNKNILVEFFKNKSAWNDLNPSSLCTTYSSKDHEPLFRLVSTQTLAIDAEP